MRAVVMDPHVSPQDFSGHWLACSSDSKSNNINVFVHLCIAVFVYLCICVFVYLCICVILALSLKVRVKISIDWDIWFSWFAYYVFVYFCICVFVYLCTCVLVPDGKKAWTARSRWTCRPLVPPLTALFLSDGQACTCAPMQANTNALRKQIQILNKQIQILI